MKNKETKSSDKVWCLGQPTLSSVSGFSFRCVTLDILHPPLSLIFLTSKTTEIFATFVSLRQKIESNYAWIQLDRECRLKDGHYCHLNIRHNRSQRVAGLEVAPDLTPAREERRRPEEPRSAFIISLCLCLSTLSSSFPSSITTAPCWPGRERLDVRGEVRAASSYLFSHVSLSGPRVS